jgi:hypothetical protein
MAPSTPPMSLRTLSLLGPAALLVTGATILCRFTVRDVAFVDLGDEGYTLQIVLPADGTPALVDGVRRRGAALLFDSNIEIEVRTGATERSVGSLPTVALLGPDGRSLPRSLPLEDGASLQRPEWEAIVSSPLRGRIVEGTIETMGVVLLIEGSDPIAGDRAKEIAHGGIEQVRSIFDRMPKDVGDPPRLLLLPHRERAREEVLLWSLGIALEAEEPSLVVFMGRARRVGGVLHGDAITASAVFGILSVIGLSCECDLDRSWMQGPRIPLRWGADAREQSVAALGFDPADPLVRSEILGILARGPASRSPSEEGGVGIEELLLGYDEVMLEELPPPAESTEKSNGAVLETIPPLPPAPPGFHPLEIGTSEDGPLSLLLLASGCCGLFGLGSIAIGVVFLLLKRKR